MKLVLISFLILLISACNKKPSTPEEVGKIFFEKILVDKDIEGSYELLSTRAKSKISAERYKSYLTKVYSQPFADEVLSYEKQFRTFETILKNQKSETKFRIGYSTTWLEPWVVAGYLREKEKIPSVSEFIKQRVDGRARTLENLNFKVTVVREGDAYLLDEEDIIERLLDKSPILGKISRPEDIR